jgi:putative transposase
MGKEDAMTRKRFSVERIVAVLKQVERGAPVAELIRHLGIAEQTFYRWNRRYAGLESEQVREFTQLQDENVNLKRLGADLSLDTVMLQDVLAKTFYGLRAGGWWSPISRPPITSVNGALAGPSAARGPRIGIGVIGIPASHSGNGCGRWRRHECALATGRFGCGSTAKGGRWASTVCIACPAKRA